MGDFTLRSLMDIDIFWLIWGFSFQLLFAGRFVIQWIASEIKRVSYIPKVFWYLSILGSVGLLIYAIHREDPVFILGQGLSLVIYGRNLMLIHRPEREIAI